MSGMPGAGGAGGPNDPNMKMVSHSARADLEAGTG